MSKKTLRKAYRKELALELRGRKRKRVDPEAEQELMLLARDLEARNNK